MHCRRVPWIVLAILLLPALAAAQDSSFARAAALQEAGDLEAAMSAYRQVLAQHPGNVEARSNLGVVLMRLGRYEEAIAEYEQALSHAAGNTTVRLNLGLAFYKSARYGKAAATFGRVLAEQPENLQARYLAADCHLRLGRPHEVIRLLQPLEASKAADDPVLAYLLGVAYLGTEQIEKGQLLIDRILRHGDSAEARVLMGTAKHRAGDLKGAAEDLKRAVEINPELPGVRAFYGQALLEAGNPDPARQEFEAALAKDPLDYDANLHLGVLLRSEQKLDEALGHLNRALGVRPGDLAVRFQIASVVLAKQETAAATRMLEAIVAEAPSFLEAQVTLATAYYRQQRRADGDRVRAIVQKLTEEKEAKERAKANPKG